MPLVQHEQYGQLLLDAIRETLETMAFAEIVPWSIMIGDKELISRDELREAVQHKMSSTSLGCGWDQSSEVESEPNAWGETSAAQPSLPESSDAWGETSAAQPLLPEPSEARGAGASPITDRMWANPLDAWEENVTLPIPEATEPNATEQLDFDTMVKKQNDWCWASMRVNSPELDCIWFIVSQQLARELARTMYAGDDFQLDNPALRDIIAELTNVLGGRLMLLLEVILGKFTLEVPSTGTGYPELPDNVQHETVTCKVFVDSTYPVICVLSFK